MLEHDQLGSAADLAQRMLDIYETEKLKVDDKTRGAKGGRWAGLKRQVADVRIYSAGCRRFPGLPSAYRTV